MEIPQKELGGLENSENVADLGEAGKIVQQQEENAKGRKIRISELRKGRRELEKEILKD